ncbi:CHAP domain-containing protein [Isobaculum melis]|uniref:N-terminal domain of peptidoglycan hydrolase CwlO-containing protein n=1 Tax=Isobaculum melis TaxID=142588 RepID=A0A1H9QPK7_9LACT|nr:CHAP domain-containing protein [Isobaculum melis]SER61673.1 N-terminal domain of peptidoglycan hydrolase CwlO-containing protein [Isobaculum melis]
MNKKFLTLAVIGTMGLSALVGPVTAFADEIDTKIQQQDEKLNELNNQKEGAKGELAKVVDSITEAETKVNDLLTEMETTQKDLEKLSREVEVLNDNIAKREEQLQKQARAIQVNGNTQSYLDFVLSSDSIGEALGRMDAVSKLVSANQDMVAKQKEDKEAVEVKKEQVAEKSAAQEKLFADYQANKAELDKQKLEKEAVVAQIAADEATVQSDKDKFLAQKQAAKDKAAAVAQEAKAREAAANTPVVAPISTNEEAGAPADNGGGVAAPPVVGGGGANVGNVGNRYAWGYCTWYVYERRAQSGNPVGSFWGNANQWAAAASAAGVPVGGTPAVGAVLQTGAGGFGHVAYVEEVRGNGDILISEMNFNGGIGVVNNRVIPAGQVGSYTYIY